MDLCNVFLFELGSIFVEIDVVLMVFYKLMDEVVCQCVEFEVVNDVLLFGLFCLDVEGWIVYINEVYCWLFGVMYEEVLVDVWFVCLYLDDCDVIMVGWCDVVVCGVGYNVEQCVIVLGLGE